MEDPNAKTSIQSFNVGDRVMAVFPYDPISGGKGFEVEAIILRDRRITGASYDSGQYTQTFPYEVLWKRLNFGVSYFTNRRYAQASWLRLIEKAPEGFVLVEPIEVQEARGDTDIIDPAGVEVAAYMKQVEQDEELGRDMQAVDEKIAEKWMAPRGGGQLMLDIPSAPPADAAPPKGPKPKKRGG